VQPLIEAEFGPNQFIGVPSGSFADLIGAIPEAEEHCSVLIQDSATTHWVEFCETYKKQKDRKRGLEFQDWAYLKETWRKQFVNPYLNSQLHFIMCGRAGYEYDHFTDDAGKKQIEKTGIKMKSEAETGYEPSLVIMMKRELDMRSNQMTHVGHILKDRRCDSQSIDGKEFPNITFADILPHVNFLNLGGKHLAHDDTRNSAGIIAADEKYDDTRRQCKILCEEINGLLAMHGLAGTAGDVVTKRIKMMAAHFGTWSKTEIEERMPLHELRERYNALHLALERKPSRYFPNQAAPELDDAIPDFGHAPVGASVDIPFPEPEPAATPAKRKGKKAAPAEIADRATILAAMIDAAESAKGDGAARIAAVSAAFAQHAESIALLSTPEQMTIKAKRSQLIGGAVTAQ
jgi:hypothetical protein